MSMRADCCTLCKRKDHIAGPLTPVMLHGVCVDLLCSGCRNGLAEVVSETMKNIRLARKKPK